MPEQTSNEINGILVETLFSLLSQKITVPTDYHGKVRAIKNNLTNDSTGMVDSLCDFLVESASVKYRIETGNSNLNEKLNRWLNEVINAEYKGLVPRGIEALAEEYFKERWKSSSFPILKIVSWTKIDGINVPSKMFFVDGESIYTKNNKYEAKILGQYQYYIGKETDDKNKLDKGVIITKPFDRWADEYTNPFLVKRGIYLNAEIIRELKLKQTDLLNQVIPYLLLIKKGSEALALAATKGEGGKIYTPAELTKQVTDLKNTLNEQRESGQRNIPTRATQFDEELSHLIPNLEPLFKKELFTVAEKHILAGFGFLDVAEAISSNRSESVLNPTGFITEINRGVKHFKQHILMELAMRIKDANPDKCKYMSEKFAIENAPVRGFVTDKFKAMIRSFYDRGLVSYQTAIEMGVEVHYEAEVTRIEREKKQGMETKLYPRIIQNQEAKGFDVNGQQVDVNGNEISEEKTNPVEKKQFEKAVKKTLETAPYSRVAELPKHLKKYSLKIKKEWMARFNSAYESKLKAGLPIKEVEDYAYKVANDILSKEDDN